MELEHDGSRTHCAVVAGIGVNGLGVVRSLARARVPTIVIDSNLSQATAKTRFARKLRVGALSGNEFIDSLLRLAATLSQKPVLILTQEESVSAVSAARERLASSYHFSLPRHETVQVLQDKFGFQNVAEEHKFPVPRSLRLHRGVDVEELGTMRFPCVIKPLARNAAYGKRFAKAYKISTATEALQLWREMSEVVQNVIMQEWIEGGDSDVYFCLQYRGPHNATPVSFVGRKICQWPPLVGGTATCVPAPEISGELLALTNAFFSTLEFVGLCSMEYKRDRRDGKFYMVEPTVGRTDYQEEIATLNGVNIPLAAYFGELGLPPAPCRRVEPPRAWRDAVAERRAFRAGATESVARVAPTARTQDPYFRFNDPMPYVFRKCEPLLRRLSQIDSGGKAAQPV